MITGEDFEIEEAVKREMKYINTLVHKKICNYGRDINKLTDWFYEERGVDMSLFDVVKSSNLNFR